MWRQLFYAVRVPADAEKNYFQCPLNMTLPLTLLRFDSVLKYLDGLGFMMCIFPSVISMIFLSALKLFRPS